MLSTSGCRGRRRLCPLLRPRGGAGAAPILPYGTAAGGPQQSDGEQRAWLRLRPISPTSCPDVPPQLMINLFGLDTVLEGFADHVARQEFGLNTVYPVFRTWAKARKGLVPAIRSGHGGDILWAVAQKDSHWQLVGWKPGSGDGVTFAIRPAHKRDSMKAPFFMQYPGHGWCQTFAALIGVATKQAAREGHPFNSPAVLVNLRQMGFEVGLPFGPPMLATKLGYLTTPSLKDPRMQAQYVHNSGVAAAKWLAYLPAPRAPDPASLRAFLLERLRDDCGILAMVTNIVNSRQRKSTVNSGPRDGTEGMHPPAWKGWTAKEIGDRVDSLVGGGDSIDLAIQKVADELSVEAYARIYALLKVRAVNPVRDFGHHDCEPKEITSDIGMRAC